MKQDLMNSIFFNPTVKNFWTMNSAFQSFPFVVNPIFNLTNPIKDAFNIINNDFVSKILFTPVSANDFWVMNPNLTGNTLILNTESFIVQPEEEIIIAFAA